MLAELARRLRRTPLTPTPTDVHLLPRFSEAVGAEVWIKRDDIGSVGYAGNKVRKLEYLAQEAEETGADTLVIVGAEQSNAARTTAAFAAATGRRCVVVVPGEGSGAAPEANHLLDVLFGAELEYVGDLDFPATEARSREIAEDLRNAGATPMVLPAGCSSPRGAFGFAAAYAELVEQLEARDAKVSAIYHASSSGGTAAGLALGRAVAGDGAPRVRSIDVGRLFPGMEQRIAGLATDAASLAGLDIAVPAGDIDLTYDHVGAGYAALTGEAREAIRLLARTEGLVCDPVYSGKGLAGLIADVRDGRAEGPVLFWHTGGAQSVFRRRFADEIL